MVLFRLTIVLGAALLCPLAFAQQPAPSDSGNQSSSSKAAPVQNDQPPAPTDDASDQKHESKLKRKLKDAAPNCIGFGGGAGKCRQPDDSEENAKQEAADRELRQRCGDARNTGQAEDQPCAELRKRDSQRDLQVGDEYFSDKHYPSAENRYRLALQEDPGNAMAMFHFAQVLEKTGKNSEAYEQYQKFLNTEPLGPDQKKARAALDRLRPYWTGSASDK
jgi:tetratricopeptide (TPR) repeat protein